MEVQIEDLRVGDEFISSTFELRYYKVLANPRVSKKLTWNKNKRYIAVKCSTNCVTTTTNYTGYNNNTYTRVSHKYELTDKNHNTTVSLNLNNKNIWLVKRAESIIL
jgi:hypothetical protein